MIFERAFLTEGSFFCILVLTTREYTCPITFKILTGKILTDRQKFVRLGRLILNMLDMFTFISSAY